MKFKDVLELNSNTVAKNIEKIKKETEEWVWVEGYKGTDRNMKCRDQQYELGKTYVMPEGSDVEVCKGGFHLCLKLDDVFRYYDIGDNHRFFKVKALVRKKDLEDVKEPTTNLYLAMLYGTNDTKLAAKSIEFISELTADEILAGVNILDMTDEEKQLALSEGTAAVRKLREEIEASVNVEKLINLGYSNVFAKYLVDNDKFDIAFALGTQTDLSMDMKVFAILKG